MSFAYANWSTRAQCVYLRTYSRALTENGSEFETWDATIRRVIRHQAWLWERAKGISLSSSEIQELDQLAELMLQRKAFPSGRSLWLGGTEISRKIESCGFNCSFTTVKTVFDLVDILWLLLQGVGVGFQPISGVLNGFMRPIPEIEIIRSTRTMKGGAEQNTETWLSTEKVWVLQVGDSAKAWAKAVGKLIAGKYPARKLILDLSQIRPAGQRLKGYGWISSGDGQMAVALKGICEVLNKSAGKLLSVLDILDIVNWMGTVLSSRRSAELALLPVSNPHWREFAEAKKDHFVLNKQRAQSNNSLWFDSKPSKGQLLEIFDLMLDGGGSEPGIINGEEALRRAPYAAGFNPCFAAGTLVYVADRGLCRIEDLEGQQVPLIDGNGNEIVCPVFMTSQSEDLWKIELENGLVYYATGYHKFVTSTGVQMVKDLQPSTPIVVTKLPVVGKINDPQRAFLDAWIISHVSNVYSVEDLQAIDLTIRKSSIQVDVRDIFNDYLKDLATISIKDDGDFWIVTILGYPVPSISQVPEYVLQGDLETIQAFVQGCVESAGYFGDNGAGVITVQMYSVFASFLNDLLQLLHLLRLEGKIESITTAKIYNPDYNDAGYYSLTIVTATDDGVVSTVSVKSITPCLEPGPVYCTHVPTTNTFATGYVMSGNCGEIILGDKGFCVHGDTWLITRSALVRIQDVVGEEVEVWNGEQWSLVVPQITGYGQQMLRVELTDGSYLDCTPYHRLSVTNRFNTHYYEVMAKTVMENPGKYAIHSEPFTIVNDSGREVDLAYELGFAYGDGYEEKDDIVIMLYGKKVEINLQGDQFYGNYRQNPDVPQRKVILRNQYIPSIDEVFLWNRKSALSFIAGLADSDGSNTESGGIRIYQADEHMIRKLQLLLTKNGIRSSVCLMAEAGKASNFNRTKAVWYVSITDCAELPCQRLNVNSGHSCRMKGKWQNIKRIYPLEGEYTSYCFEEPFKHKAVFNNMLTYQCNLTEVVLPRFNGAFDELERAIYLIARANYRQSCVNLDDGILQRTWHELNDYLRLCGVGLTGIVQWEFVKSGDAFKKLREVARRGADSMADALDMPRSAAVTTVKPSGTLSKVADCTEGVHKPIGRYLINNINFSSHDPLVDVMKAAGYRVTPHPYSSDSVLVAIPVSYAHVELETQNGKDVDKESALSQLERYHLLMKNYVDHNISSTILYQPGEIRKIVDWLHKNWDDYVATAFMLRNDIDMDNHDYPYLPQELLTKEQYDEYCSTLAPVNFVNAVKQGGFYEIDNQECASGSCPVK